MPSELLQPSPELSVIVGDVPLSWVKICELVVNHIQENNLATHPYITTDATLRAVVGDLEQVSVSEVTRALRSHVSPTGRKA